MVEHLVTRSCSVNFLSPRSRGHRGFGLLGGCLCSGGKRFGAGGSAEDEPHRDHWAAWAAVGAGGGRHRRAGSAYAQ